MKVSRPNLSVIIVSYNKPFYLRRCLNSIFRFHKNINFEVIVIDNNSTDKNVDLINNSFPQVKLIQNKDNLGFAKANNIGAKIARSEILAFINSDVEFISNVFYELLNYTRSIKFGAIGVQLLNKNGSLQKSYYRFPSLLQRILILTKINESLKPGSYWLKFYTKKSNSRSLLKVQSIRGAFMIISKRIFDEIGGFDENYFLYHEELDLCFQLHKASMPVLFNPNLFVIHYGDHKELPENEFVFYQRNRSLLYFYYKNSTRLNTILLVIINILFLFIKNIFSIFGSNQSQRIYIRVLKMNLYFLKNYIIFGKNWDIPSSPDSF